VLASLVTLLVAAASGSGSAQGRYERPCMSGASSVTATFVDGNVHVSVPQTSGCIPPPARPPK